MVLMTYSWGTDVAVPACHCDTFLSGQRGDNSFAALELNLLIRSTRISKVERTVQDQFSRLRRTDYNASLPYTKRQRCLSWSTPPTTSSAPCSTIDNGTAQYSETSCAPMGPQIWIHGRYSPSSSVRATMSIQQSFYPNPMAKWFDRLDS